MTETSDDRIEKTARDFVRRQLAEGVSRSVILAHLATRAESLSEDEVVSSILVLDREGRLRNGASPQLPADYLAAIDGLRPDPSVGTCAAAAATGRIVITPDFLADDKWAELRQLPLGLGFVAAWSVPILSKAGTVLGTFGTYFRRHRAPTELEREGVTELAGAAAIVLET